MRYVAAYLLAVMGGKDSPSQTDIEKILSAVGIESDAERIKTIISELNGKSIEDVIAQGTEKLASMPVGGAAVAAPAATAAAAAPVAEAAKEDKKAAKEESESEDEDMGFGLFD